MLDLPDNGLYRTTQPMPGNETAIPSGVLVFVGQSPNGGGKFVVRPSQNRNNRWYWSEPTTQLRSPTWAKTLKRLPAEGFYTLPEVIEMENGGRWLKNALVQLGFNEKGQGIVFVGERHESSTENVLRFSDRGMVINDDMMARLTWAPILPVRDDS
jgi:hypothetical protein